VLKSGQLRDYDYEVRFFGPEIMLQGRCARLASEITLRRREE